MKTLEDFLKEFDHGKYADHIKRNVTIIIKQLNSTTQFPKFGSVNQNITNFISSGGFDSIRKSDRVSQYCEYPVIMVDNYMNNLFIYIDGTTLYQDEPKFYWDKENYNV